MTKKENEDRSLCVWHLNLHLKENNPLIIYRYFIDSIQILYLFLKTFDKIFRKLVSRLSSSLALKAWINSFTFFFLISRIYSTHLLAITNESINVTHLIRFNKPVHKKHTTSSWLINPSFENTSPQKYRRAIEAFKHWVTQEHRWSPEKVKL